MNNVFFQNLLDLIKNNQKTAEKIICVPKIGWQKFAMLNWTKDLICICSWASEFMVQDVRHRRGFWTMACITSGWSVMFRELENQPSQLFQTTMSYFVEVSFKRFNIAQLNLTNLIHQHLARTVFKAKTAFLRRDQTDILAVDFLRLLHLCMACLHHLPRETAFTWW